MSEEEKTESQDLDRALTTGIAWTASIGWAVQGLRWAATLVIARILAPEDYGLVGMATVFTGLIQMINEFGLGAAIIQRGKRLSSDQIAELGGIAVLVGIALAGASALASPLVAAFFDESRVTLIIVVLGTHFIIDALKVVPRSLLRRDLEFKMLALLEGLAGIVLAASTLIYAVLGWGHWALIFGITTSVVASSIVANLIRPHRISFPRSLSKIASEVRFGLHVTASRITWYLYSNADFAVVGRVFGESRLGEYTIAWSLASAPLERVTTIIGRVTPSVLAAVQDQPSQLRRYICRLTEGISMVVFPASIGLAVIAPDFIPLILGDHWVGAVPLLQILALSTAIRALDPPLNQLLVAVDRPELGVRFNVIAVICLPALFVIGTRWGAEGTAAVWLTAYPTLAATLLLRWAMQSIELSLGQYLAALWPAASSSLVMLSAIWATHAWLPDDQSRGIRLVLTIVVGILSYSAIAGTLHRDRIRRFVELRRHFRSRQ